MLKYSLEQVSENQSWDMPILEQGIKQSLMCGPRPGVTTGNRDDECRASKVQITAQDQALGLIKSAPLNVLAVRTVAIPFKFRID